MASFIIISCILFFILIIRWRIKDYISKFFSLTFLIFWGSGLIISTTQPFGFYEITIETYAIVLISMGSFLVGFSIFKLKANMRSCKFDNIEETATKITNSWWLSLFLLIISLYELRFANNALILAVIDNESTSINKFEGIFMGNTIGCWIWMYIMFPLFYSINVLVAICITRHHKIKFHSLLPIIFFYVIFGILTGGRGIFANFLYSIFIIFICLNPRFLFNKINIKFIGSVIALIGIAFIGMLYMSAYRGHGEFYIAKENLEESVNDMTERPLRYISLPYVLLDISFKENYLHKFGGYQMGKATFAGGDILLCGLANRAGIKLNSSQFIFDYLQNEWKSCAPDHAYNYAYTGILTHYLDFGLIGVIIFPFMFGFITRVIIIEFYNYKTIWGLLSINLFYFLMIQAAFSNFLQNPPIFLYLLYLLIMEFYSIIKMKYRISFRISSNSRPFFNITSPIFTKNKLH